jgi:hypothetical protein
MECGDPAPLWLVPGPNGSHRNSVIPNARSAEGSVATARDALDGSRSFARFAGLRMTSHQQEALLLSGFFQPYVETAAVSS